MASKPSSVALRLGMEGKEDIKSGFDEIAASGDAAAKRAATAWQKASDDIASATQRQAQAAQKLAAAAPTSMQAQVNQSVGTGYDASSNATAAQYTRLLAEEERQVEALRNAIDPLRVAQAAYDKEVAIASGLAQTGKISETEKTAAIALSSKALLDAKKRLDDHSSSLGLNRTQAMVAEGAIHRFADSVLAGQDPIRAATMQAGDFANILALDDGGVAGALTKVRALINPLTIALGVETAGVVLAVAAWLEYSSQIGRMTAISQGAGAVIGTTAQALEDQAEAAAAAGRISVAAARDIETAYVSMGGIANSVLGGLTAMTGDFAAATGKDAKAAIAELGKDFQDPIKGAADLAEKYGALTQAQIDHIQKLVEQGDLYQAQAQLLHDLEGRFDGAADHARGFASAFRDIATWASNAWTTIGKFLDNDIGDAAAKIAKLQAERAQLVSLQPANPTSIQADIDAVDRQIADLKRQAGAVTAAGRNSAQQNAQAAADTYTGGDSLDAIRQRLGALNKGIGAGGNADQLKAWTEARDADQRALDTWIPKQEKANELAAADAKVAAARTPAQKAAAASEREMIALKGTSITQADAEARARDAAAKATGNATKAGDTHAATLAREAQAEEVSTRGALALADAYLQGGSAALIAEARRKAMTDATKKGADVEAEVRRQIALTVADAVANGAKAVAQMDAENAARAKVIAAVQGGTLAAGQMNDALSDEAALRPLIALRAVAEGAARDKLTEVIERQTAALAEQHKLQQEMAAISATQSANDNIAAARDAIQFAGDRSGAGDIEIARRTAMRDANRQYAAAPQSVRDDYVAAQVGAAQAKQDESRAKYLADMKNSQSDALKLSQAELDTVTMNTDQREIALDKLKATIDLQAHGVDLASADAKTRLAGVQAQDELNQALARASSAMQEVRDFGDEFVEDLAAGKNLSQDLYQEFLKLAAINPLKNLINGNNNLPTLSSIFSLFGGSGLPNGGSALDLGDAIKATAPTFDTVIPHYDSGTEYASGGYSWVGENGKELLKLPQGSQIVNAPTSNRMMQAANDPARMHVTIGIDDDILTAKVTHISDGRIALAAPGIANGGAQLAQARATKRARYRIPGR